MRPHLLAPVLLAALPCAHLVAQAEILTPVVPDVRKFVVHDQGAFWYGAFALQANGDLNVLGNPWFGGGIDLARTGVNDVARLDAFTPGATESVVVVDDTGLHRLTWNPKEDPMLPDVDVFDIDLDAAVQDAQMVRAAAFAPHHTIVVVPNGGMSLRVYRTNLLVATVTLTTPALDVEVVRLANGAARLLLRDANGMHCLTPNGTPVWTHPGVDGRFARFPVGSATRAAWVHRSGPGSDWQVLLIDDGLPAAPIPMSSALHASADVSAVYVAHLDLDTHLDFVVRTNAKAFVVRNFNGDFSGMGAHEVIFPARPGCVPDVMVTEDGDKVRLVDEQLTP